MTAVKNSARFSVDLQFGGTLQDRETRATRLVRIIQINVSILVYDLNSIQLEIFFLKKVSRIYSLALECLVACAPGTKAIFVKRLFGGLQPEFALLLSIYAVIQFSSLYLRSF